MKSIANQYRDLKEGRMSQANFMRNLRMMMPQHVTNVTSFNDAIRILKSKSILTEAMDIQPVPEADEEFESDDAETQAMIDKIEKEMAGEEAVKAQYDITEAKQKVDADRVHPNELSMGIRVEMEHTKDAEKAKKIALDHLAENPFYYTQLKLSGVDVKATPSKEKKAIAKKKDETELVDKANQMKPVKGVEKAKASANKATKETNKPVKGISLMSLIAKTARGVQKMAATGEKMKVVREGQENYYQTNVRLKPEEQQKIKSVLLDAEFEWDEDDRKQVVYSKKSEKEIQNVVDNVTGMATPSSGPKQSGVAKFLTKEDLAEMVREVLAEMESDDEVTADVALGMDETMDGRDNLTDTAGHQLNELSGALSKVKDKIVNSSLFKKLIDTIVSKMSDKDIATFKAKFNIAEAEGGPSLEDIMAKVDTINPDKTAKTPEDLKEVLDEDTLEGKIANLVRSVAGINLVALGGVPLGLLINSLLGISTWGFGAFIGPVISLVASLIIHGISSKLLGKTDDDSVI